MIKPVDISKNRLLQYSPDVTVGDSLVIVRPGVVGVGTDITSIEAGVATNLSLIVTETSNRVAADTELDSRLDSLEAAGVGSKARFVELDNGVALEVWSESTSSWVRQTEWTED